jgi:polyhydroxybutyrate depolymerase
VLALALVVVCSAVGLAPSTGAASCSRTPTVGLEPRLADGGHYLLSVPKGIKGRAPLLVALHGNPSTAESEAASWAWETMATGYVVAYPMRDVHSSSGDTPPLNWDWSKGSRDVGFLRGVIRAIATTYCVDAARIHVTGTSGGAFMAQRMACDAADVVASVGEYAGGYPEAGRAPFGPARGGTCAPTRPLSVIMFHGSADTTVAPGEGRVSRITWGERLGCTGVTKQRHADGVLVTLAPCRGGTEVVWREYTGGDHFSTAMDHGDEIRQMQLAFFSRHAMSSR